MNIKNEALFKNGTENLEKFISDYTRPIISIKKNPNKDDVNEEINAYRSKYPEKNKITSQSGRTWILIGRKGKKIYSLNVGQSIDIFKEIELIIGTIINKKGPYYELSNRYTELLFYEILNDEYIKRSLDLDEEQLRNLAYELTKDYLAEYLVAKNTAAKHWNYYGSGMDKRYYFHFDIK